MRNYIWFRHWEHFTHPAEVESYQVVQSVVQFVILTDESDSQLPACFIDVFFLHNK